MRVAGRGQKRKARPSSWALPSSCQRTRLPRSRGANRSAMAGALCGRRQMRAARPLLGEKPASGAVRVEVDGDNDSLKTYFMPAGGTTSAMGLVSRVTPVQTAMRNCTRDEGRSFAGKSGVDLKPPQAAVVKSNGGERCG